jgi:hypothetical protein
MPSHADNLNFAQVDPRAQHRIADKTLNQMREMKSAEYEAQQAEEQAKQEAYRQQVAMNERFSLDACSKLKEWAAFWRTYTYNIQFNEVQKNWIFTELTSLAAESAPEYMFYKDAAPQQEYEE